MYVVGKLSWLRMLFKYRGTALRRTKARIAFTTGVACVLTVAAFDDESQAGWLLLDDGSRLDFPAEAFAASGLRLLRIGQRANDFV